MRLALMQPYFFPYIGYFELVAGVDKFILYDDASYSKNSWYNRNRVLSATKAFEYIRVAVSNEKLGTAVREVRATNKEQDLNRTLSVCAVYKRAPYYTSVLDLIRDTFHNSSDGLADIAGKSVILTSEYLGFKTTFQNSSQIAYDRSGSAEQKVISVCKASRATEYVNLSGGKHLYLETNFNEAGLELSFSPPSTFRYDEGPHRETEFLSIIDTLMFCSPLEIRSYIELRT